MRLRCAATEMAVRLHAKHRWCITGTPIQCKLDDLYGFLRFLKASSFDALRWWIEVTRDPYERGDARAMRQHETCVGYAREVIESFRDDSLKTVAGGSKLSDTFITHVEASKLLNSLLKLRQACCHPQVGSSGLRSLQQSPMTMEEILVVSLVFTSNGLDIFQLVVLDSSQQYEFDGQLLGSPKDQVAKMYNAEECDQHVAKRLKLSSEASYLANGLSGEKIRETKTNLLTATSDELRLACENLKQKFLSAVNSKLALAQLDFRKSYEQVSSQLFLKNTVCMTRSIFGFHVHFARLAVDIFGHKYNGN
ncbi:hypothetical protein RJ640_030002 [Escallonia rubra]|uniref:SNF2 N-terminal domain-containing protein n=1 Tax=Escallonia rubra TaxID=112253 RepID=A0AA88U6S0_9ASTE|nr:hypothetical protein RJ640_030002 [Escallonia rubra]